jgi:predicted nuclease of restriction endonuclease-like RecB superfamily
MGNCEGRATGKLSIFTGKTDILIRAEGRNVFIVECKFWHEQFLMLVDVKEVKAKLPVLTIVRNWFASTGASQRVGFSMRLTSGSKLASYEIVSGACGAG